VLLENLWRVIKRFFTIAFIMLIFLTGVVVIAIASYIGGLPQYHNPSAQAQIYLAMVFGGFLIFLGILIGVWWYYKAQQEGFGEEEF
jgi:TRAP-type C4-dicarboxylate transport system permease small subunit